MTVIERKPPSVECDFLIAETTKFVKYSSDVNGTVVLVNVVVQGADKTENLYEQQFCFCDGSTTFYDRVANRKIDPVQNKKGPPHHKNENPRWEVKPL